MTHENNAVILLDTAVEAYEKFQDAMAGLSYEMLAIDPWLYQRIDAYPGWHGDRDMGGGQDMLGWLDEIAKRLGVSEK